MIKVLDKGWIELIDHLGDDSRIVAAARLSYDHETKGEEKDKKLIKYLLDHHHMSPFEMPHVTFRMKAPIFVLRQLMRHRMANWNEVSLRYVEFGEHEDLEDFYIPAVWRGQDKFNKQSGTGEINQYCVKPSFLQYEYALGVALKTYKELIDNGVAREQARMILPVSIYSKVMFTLDLRNLINLLNQRDHEGAQWETQQYAKAMKALVTPIFPWTFEQLQPHE